MTGETRLVTIPEDIEESLRGHQVRQPDTGPKHLVLTSPTGQVINYSNWRHRVWARIFGLSGVECVPHDRRRTATTRPFRVDRWSPPEVQAYMVHRDPRTTLKI